MARPTGIGIQDFEKVITSNNFYIDKTMFIKEWWENNDDVTLITRPRRFGKTLTMDMVRRFFSLEYKEKGSIFQKLSIWKEDMYRQLQGTYPVIFLTFSGVKAESFEQARKEICNSIKKLYNHYDFLLESDCMNSDEKAFFKAISIEIEDYAAAASIQALSGYLYHYYGKKVLILLDEYDTPMQEAYVNGYREKLVLFIRKLFNYSFKTNPYLERAIMTGVTRVSKESIFSDLNNLEVVTTTSEKYEASFGFTEAEVWASLEEYGLRDQKNGVQEWYDGFSFGKRQDIYNPWSILNYLDKKRFAAYWVNTSSNGLVDKLIREGSADVKIALESLLKGIPLIAEIDEQIVFDSLDLDENAMWSLLLSGGYLKVKAYDAGEETYELVLTNKEVFLMFRKIIKKWFSRSVSVYNGFIKALLDDDVEAMNVYMNEVAFYSFSSFDTGKKPSSSEPERFYHGFVLGLMVELSGRYVITSNRESGFGRYDVTLEPCQSQDGAMILEFKVYNPDKEETLKDTVQSALNQIEEKGYEANLIAKGISPQRIRKYGFAFQGKTVLIG